MVVNFILESIASSTCIEALEMTISSLYHKRREVGFELWPKTQRFKTVETRSPTAEMLHDCQAASVALSAEPTLGYESDPGAVSMRAESSLEDGRWGARIVSPTSQETMSSRVPPRGLRPCTFADGRVVSSCLLQV